MYAPMTRKAIAYAYLLLILLVLLHGWIVPRNRALGPVKTNQQGGDTLVFNAVVERLQQGEPYYAAMRTELQARGYPTASLFNWRTPLHLHLLAAITIPGARLVLAAMAIAAIWLLMRASSAPRATVVLVGVPVLASTTLVALSEAWAGTLVALSLGAYVRRQWTLGAVCGLLAVFVRELAVVYAVVGAACALSSRRRAESFTWALGGVLYLIYYGWHTQNVFGAIPPDAQSHGASWVHWGGLAFVFRTVECYGLATLAPSLMAPLVVAAGIFGILSPQMPLHARVSLIGYLGAFAVLGLPINRYWGLVTVPLWGLGALHSLSGLERLCSLSPELATMTNRARPILARLHQPAA